MNANTLTLHRVDGLTSVYCPACDQHVGGVDLVDIGPIAQPWEIWVAHLVDVHNWAAPAAPAE